MKKRNNIIDLINNILLIFIFVLSFSFFSTKTVISSSNVYLDKNSFISSISSIAENDMKETGVYASVTIGQAAIESGWGKDNIAVLYNNYFGMKAGGKVSVNGVETKCTSANRNVIGQSSASNTYWSGAAVCLGASEGGGSWFRVYDSLENSVKDHSRNFWCIKGGRYIKNGVFAATDPLSQLNVIAKSGYAVDKNGNITKMGGLQYDEYIYQKVIRPNNLTSYDAGYQSGIKPAYAETCTDAVYTGGPISANSSNLNAVSNFITTYTGNLKEGYLYKAQYGKGLKATEKTEDSEVGSKLDNIVKKIFDTTGTYSDGKVGASAYLANVEYLTGSFKNQIHYFNQNDYPNEPYGKFKNATIKSHGCGPTSMAIVISSFKGQDVSPVETTNWACNNGYCTDNGSSHELIPAIAKQYGLSSSNEIKSTGDLQQVVNALASTKSLVVVLARAGKFTKSGHFFVLTGVDSEGNISIADPASRKNNESKYKLDYLINPTQGHIDKFWIISEG